MKLSIDEVLGRLEREDAVPVGTREKASETLAAQPEPLPWYSRGLTGFYGWVAALCFVELAQWQLPGVTGWLAGERDWLVFYRVLGGLELAAGLLALGAAIVLRRFKHRGYLAHLSLSLALAGEIVAVKGMHDLTSYHHVAVPLFMLGVELLLLVAYPDSLMRFLCTLGASYAVFELWHRNLGYSSVDVLVLAALAGSLLLFHFRRLPPVAYGLAMASCAWMLGALEKYSHLELGWPARIGVAALLLVQVALVLRRKHLIATAAVGIATLAALSFGSPGVLAGVALLAAALHRRELKLVGLAAVFLVFFYSYLYYSMDQSLLFKSGLLLGNGLCFVLLWRLLGAQTTGERPVAIDRRVIAMALAGALLVVNGLIVQKERVLDTGDPVLVELRPADPRSLMEGDYMTLRYRIADRYEPHPSDGRMVVKTDPAGVASFVRWDDGKPLQPGERLLRYRERNGALRLGAEAFFFEEGKGDLYARAKYGELRVTRRGDSVLVGLRDAERNRLGRALR